MYITRSQADSSEDHAQHDMFLVCPPEEDKTRQEFRDEQDVNLLMQRYGASIPQQPVQYGEVDFDLDLHTAYGAVQRVREGFNSLDPALRVKYPTLDHLVAALATGTVTVGADGTLSETTVAVPTPAVAVPL